MLRVHVRSHAGGDSPRPRAGRAGQARLPTERPPVRGLFLAPRGAAARAREGGTGPPAALGRVDARWPPSRTTCRPRTGLEWGAAGGVAGTPVLAIGWNGPDGRTEGHSGPRVSLARAVGAATPTPTPTRTPLAPRGGGGGAQGQRLLLLCRQPRRPRRHCRSEAQAPRPPAGASARSPSPAGPRHSCLQTLSSRPPSPGRRPGWGSAAGAAPPPAGGRGLAGRAQAGSAGKPQGGACWPSQRSPGGHAHCSRPRPPQSPQGRGDEADGNPDPPGAESGAGRAWAGRRG